MLACGSEHKKNESKCPVLNRHQYVRKRKIETHAGLTYPESTEGGRRVSVLKRQEGAPVLLG